MTKTIIPNSPEELKEMLLDEKQRQNLMKSPEDFQAFVDSYAHTVLDKDKTIQQQADEQAQAQLAEMLKNAREEGFGPDPKLKFDPTDVRQVRSFAAAQQKGTAYNKLAPGAAIDREMTTLEFEEYFQSIHWNAAGLPGGPKLMQNREVLRRISNDFGSDIPSDGGFLIPEVMRSQVLKLSLEQAMVRPRATVLPMSSLRLPVPTIDETTHVGSVRGGLVAYWTEEGAALVNSSAKFARVILEAKKLTMYTEVPNELPQDAPAFSALLGQILPEAVAYFEDDAFTNGDGVGEPLGWVNANCAIGVTRTGNGTSGHNTGIGWLDVVSMYARMLPQSLANAVWVASIDTLPTLATITTGGVNSTNPGYPLLTNIGGLPDAPRWAFMGHPLFLTEKTPQLNSPGDLSFVDFSEYLIGDRQAMQASSSQEYRFGVDKTAYRIIERVDGTPWIQTPLTPRNGGPTLSPVVQLTAGS